MLLDARQLVVRHHPSLPAVLTGVDLHVAPGELIAVIGSNGSGKSTLARALVGLLPLESGQLRGAGPDGRPRVGLVMQDPAAQLIAVTVADEIALGPEGAGQPPAEVARRVGTLVTLHDLDPWWHRDPAHLSGGQQQRVAVAAIEACDVDVLVLDEPTALLDRPAREHFLQSVRHAAAGRGVVWVTQEPDELAHVDRIVLLDAGTVAWSGSVAEYVAAPEVAATFGLDLPAAARITHGLIARGAWPATLPVPVTVPQLLAAVEGADRAR